MIKKKTVLIRRGTKAMLSIPPKCDEHNKNSAHWTWEDNPAFSQWIWHTLLFSQPQVTCSFPFISAGTTAATAPASSCHSASWGHEPRRAPDLLQNWTSSGFTSSYPLWEKSSQIMLFLTSTSRSTKMRIHQNSSVSKGRKCHLWSLLQSLCHEIDLLKLFTDLFHKSSVMKLFASVLVGCDVH